MKTTSLAVIQMLFLYHVGKWTGNNDRKTCYGWRAINLQLSASLRWCGGLSLMTNVTSIIDALFFDNGSKK